MSGPGLGQGWGSSGAVLMRQDRGHTEAAHKGNEASGMQGSSKKFRMFMLFMIFRFFRFFRFF